MTLAWAKRFIELVEALAVSLNLTPQDVEDVFQQFLLDAGKPIEFQDPSELEDFRVYCLEHGERGDEDDGDEASRDLTEIKKKMREFADRRGYYLTDEEFEEIVAECAEEGDRLEDCPDGMLREIVEDWVADHS